MKLFVNFTSPFGRIARVALREKGFDDIDECIVDPWSDPPDFLAANPAARVPTLLLDDGRVLTESLLIVQWLEATRPRPSLLGDDAVAVLSRTGVAMGVIEAGVAIIIGRKMVNPDFDALPVGARRIRTIVEGLKRLNADPPVYPGGVPSLAVIAAVDAIDYVRFRFPNAAWMPALDRLDALVAATGERESIVQTRPR